MMVKNTWRNRLTALMITAEMKSLLGGQLLARGFLNCYRVDKQNTHTALAIVVGMFVVVWWISKVLTAVFLKKFYLSQKISAFCPPAASGDFRDLRDH